MNSLTQTIMTDHINSTNGRTRRYLIEIKSNNALTAVIYK